MSVPQWPFTRRRPGGYVDDGTDVPSAADLTAIDEQISRAANGLLWSDAVLLKNFQPAVDVSPCDKGIVFDPTRRFWYAFGSAGGAADGVVSKDCGSTWTSLTLTGVPSSASPTCSATDGFGALVLGYAPPGASTTKGRYTHDGFTTSSALILGGNNTDSVVAIYFSARLSLWLASLSSGSIWSSASLGGTWTQRSTGVVVTSFIESSDRILAVTAAGATNYYSLDGLTWTATAILPTGAFAVLGAAAFVSSPTPGYFVVTSNTGGTDSAASSPDAVTWTLVSTQVPQGGVTGIGYGRMMAMAAKDPSGIFWEAFYSLDTGATWARSGELYLPVSSGTMKLVLGQDQFLVSTAISTNRFLARGIRGGL